MKTRCEYCNKVVPERQLGLHLKHCKWHRKVRAREQRELQAEKDPEEQVQKQAKKGKAGNAGNIKRG